VAYGDSFSQRLHWGVQAGKLYSGRGYARGEVVRAKNGDTVNQVMQDTEHAETWSATGGLLYALDEQFRVGLVGRNFISPELDFNQIGDVQYDPSFDLGLAWFDFEAGLTISADLHNLTRSNNVGCHCMAGLEKHLSPDLRGRIGVDESSVFGGIGWMAGSVALDVSFGADPEERLMMTIRTPL
jgi:hypothetical protein